MKPTPKQADARRPTPEGPTPRSRRQEADAKRADAKRPTPGGRRQEGRRQEADARRADAKRADARRPTPGGRRQEADARMLPPMTLARHITIVPLRYAHEDTQLGSYDISAGTRIAINLYACNMDEKVWNEPEEWKPERFLASNFEAMDLYKTMAFGAGKRVCAGSLQASLVSCTAIGRFVQEFEWILKEEEEDDVGNLKRITSQKVHPMHAYITPRAMNGSAVQSS